MRKALVCFCLTAWLPLTVAACGTQASVEECLVDGGYDEVCLRELDNAEVPSGTDDGGVFGFDNPDPAAPDPAATCVALVQKTCGAAAASDCTELPACTAAQLLATHEPTRCADALSNEQSYPACEQSACAELVDLVCGAGGASTGLCASASSCALAAQWQQQATTSDKAADRQDAQAACGAALSDPLVFAPCAP